MIVAGPDQLRSLMSARNANDCAVDFAEFSRILLIFTAVAVPAHLLQRGNVLRWVGLLLGEWIGIAVRSSRLPAWLLVPCVTLLLTWAMAAAFHNTTSILVCAQIIVVICRSYSLPVLPTLSGALVASNLVLNCIS